MQSKTYLSLQISSIFFNSKIPAFELVKFDELIVVTGPDSSQESADRLQRSFAKEAGLKNDGSSVVEGSQLQNLQEFGAFTGGKHVTFAEEAWSPMQGQQL